ncbi:MAG TPA: methyltransferase domain-containing protein [Methylomirabilota bacterium]|nr:methyltransferase domain-containing protein [Methylomirabilota bacterium]
MPFTFELDPAAGVVRTTAHGLIRYEDLATHVRALLDAGLARIPQLIDARHAEHDLSADDMRRLAGLVGDLHAPAGVSRRTALVVTALVDYGMARMYGTLAQKVQPDFAVFRDLGEAEAWLLGPRDPIDRLRRSFDQVAEDYATQFFDELDRKPFDRERLQAFAARCPPREPVLEVGCGPGHVGRFVAALGPRVVGLDLSEQSVRIARRLNPRLRFMVGDMRALPLRDGDCGALLAFYTLIYFDAPATAAILAEYRRVLRSGAPILLAVHGGDGSERFTDFRGKPIDVTLHYHRLDALAGQLGQAGFSVEAAESRPAYEFEHPTPRLYLAATAR